MWTEVSVERVPPSRWLNGGGQTRELVAWPIGLPEWTLRVSIADIAQDGPFSAFHGIRRWFAILEGGGVRLADSVNLTVGDPLYEFDGALAPACSLLDGQPVRDFNVMFRENPEHTVKVIDAKSEPAWTASLKTKWIGLFTVDQGAIVVNSTGTKELGRMSLIWSDSLEPSTTLTAQFFGSGAAYWIILEAN
ncbi:hypothetical protein LEN26_002864 [Aphanomyces euteiches]|nr:hypothetical protein AeMF1_017493 [Aphanomyces euteiches]KAH9158587.1 hypothetical protein LEN26_002864 [Aphanomyces euteiches]KAH9183332.1 hypothetical protein AeNC1_014691 [Aphanomyces euteiches]